MLHSEQDKQILIVEDEGIIAADIQSRLERLGYRVPAIARSGEEALDFARATPFDLVLMDIRLKGEMDGIATSAALKAEISHRSGWRDASRPRRRYLRMRGDDL